MTNIAYVDAATEKRFCGQPTLAITFGHNKDHRPDLKQLPYILIVSEDRGVPLHFRVESDYTTDDQTYRHTWDPLCKLIGRADFLTHHQTYLLDAADAPGRRDSN
jgi:transposase